MQASQFGTLVAFHHGGADFGADRPVTAPLPGMSFLFIQAGGVRLHNLSLFQEQQARFVGGHARDEGFSLGQELPNEVHRSSTCKRKSVFTR